MQVIVRIAELTAQRKLCYCPMRMWTANYRDETVILTLVTYLSCLQAFSACRHDKRNQHHIRLKSKLTLRRTNTRYLPAPRALRGMTDLPAHRQNSPQSAQCCGECIQCRTVRESISPPSAYTSSPMRNTRRPPRRTSTSPCFSAS